MIIVVHFHWFHLFYVIYVYILYKQVLTDLLPSSQKHSSYNYGIFKRPLNRKSFGFNLIF